MNSSKMSLKEGFDFLFEAKDQPKIKLTFNTRTKVTRKNAILYALSFDIFEAIVNKEETTSLQKAKSVGDRGEDESNIYHGTGVALNYLLQPARSNLTKPHQYVNLMQDEEETVGASSGGHVKAYLENVEAALRILYDIGAKKLQLESKKPKSFIVKVNKAAYDRLVLQIMSGKLTSILNTSGSTINFKIDELHKRLRQNINLLVKTTIAKSDKARGKEQEKINKAQDEFKGVQRSADIFEAWVKMLRRGDDALYQVDQDKLKQYRKITDPVKKKKKMLQLQYDFNHAVFRGVKNRPKMLDAIRQNKFDFIIYALSGAGFKKESKVKDPNRKYSSRLQDRAFIKLFEMLYEKTVSDDILQQILTEVNNFYKEGKNRKTVTKNLSRTKEYRKIKSLLNSQDATPTGNLVEEETPEEAEQNAEETEKIISVESSQDDGTQSEELQGDETTSSGEADEEGEKDLDLEPEETREESGSEDREESDVKERNTKLQYDTIDSVYNKLSEMREGPEKQKEAARIYTLYALTGLACAEHEGAYSSEEVNSLIDNAKTFKDFYRTTAMKFHPDRNNTPYSENIFKIFQFLNKDNYNNIEASKSLFEALYGIKNADENQIFINKAEFKAAMNKVRSSYNSHRKASDVLSSAEQAVGVKESNQERKREILEDISDLITILDSGIAGIENIIKTRKIEKGETNKSEVIAAIDALLIVVLPGIKDLVAELEGSMGPLDELNKGIDDKRDKVINLKRQVDSIEIDNETSQEAEAEEKKVKKAKEEAEENALVIAPLSFEDKSKAIKQSLDDTLFVLDIKKESGEESRSEDREESDDTTSSVLEIINADQMDQGNIIDKVFNLEGDEKKEELKKIVSILLTAEIYGALNNIDTSTIFQTSVGQEIMLKDAFSGVSQFLAKQNNVKGVKEFSRKVAAAKYQLGGSNSVQLSLVEAIAPKYVLTMSHGVTTTLISGIIKSLKDDLSGKFDAGATYKKIFAASGNFKISFSFGEEASTQDKDSAEEVNQLPQQEKDRLLSQYKTLAADFNDIADDLNKLITSNKINDGTAKAKALQTCRMLSTLLEKAEEICKSLGASSNFLQKFEERSKELKKISKDIDKINLDNLSPREEEAIEQEVKEAEIEADQTNREIDNISPEKQPEAIEQEIDNIRDDFSSLESDDKVSREGLTVTEEEITRIDTPDVDNLNSKKIEESLVKDLNADNLKKLFNERFEKIYKKEDLLFNALMKQLTENVDFDNLDEQDRKREIDRSLSLLRKPSDEHHFTSLKKKITATLDNIVPNIDAIRPEIRHVYKENLSEQFDKLYSEDGKADIEGMKAAYLTLISSATNRAIGLNIEDENIFESLNELFNMKAISKGFKAAKAWAPKLLKGFAIMGTLKFALVALGFGGIIAPALVLLGGFSLFTAAKDIKEFNRQKKEYNRNPLDFIENVIFSDNASKDLIEMCVKEQCSNIIYDILTKQELRGFEDPSKRLKDFYKSTNDKVIVYNSYNDDQKQKLKKLHEIFSDRMKASELYKNDIITDSTINSVFNTVFLSEKLDNQLIEDLANNSLAGDGLNDIRGKILDAVKQTSFNANFINWTSDKIAADTLHGKHKRFNIEYRKKIEDGEEIDNKQLLISPEQITKDYINYLYSSAFGNFLGKMQENINTGYANESFIYKDDHIIKGSLSKLLFEDSSIILNEGPIKSSLNKIEGINGLTRYITTLMIIQMSSSKVPAFKKIFSFLKINEAAAKPVVNAAIKKYATDQAKAIVNAAANESDSSAFKFLDAIENISKASLKSETWQEYIFNFWSQLNQTAIELEENDPIRKALSATEFASQNALNNTDNPKDFVKLFNKDLSDNLGASDFYADDIIVPLEDTSFAGPADITPDSLSGSVGKIGYANTPAEALQYQKMNIDPIHKNILIEEGGKQKILQFFFSSSAKVHGKAKALGCVKIDLETGKAKFMSSGPGFYKNYIAHEGNSSYLARKGVTFTEEGLPNADGNLAQELAPDHPQSLKGLEIVLKSLKGSAKIPLDAANLNIKKAAIKSFIADDNVSNLKIYNSEDLALYAYRTWANSSAISKGLSQHIPDIEDPLSNLKVIMSHMSKTMEGVPNADARIKSFLENPKLQEMSLKLAKAYGELVKIGMEEPKLPPEEVGVEPGFFSKLISSIDSSIEIDLPFGSGDEDAESVFEPSEIFQLGPGDKEYDHAEQVEKAYEVIQQQFVKLISTEFDKEFDKGETEAIIKSFTAPAKSLGYNPGYKALTDNVAQETGTSSEEVISSIEDGDAIECIDPSNTDYDALESNMSQQPQPEELMCNSEEIETMMSSLDNDYEPNVSSDAAAAILKSNAKIKALKSVKPANEKAAKAIVKAKTSAAKDLSAAKRKIANSATKDKAATVKAVKAGKAGSDNAAKTAVKKAAASTSTGNEYWHGQKWLGDTDGIIPMDVAGGLAGAGILAKVIAKFYTRGLPSGSFAKKFFRVAKPEASLATFLVGALTFKNNEYNSIFGQTNINQARDLVKKFNDGVNPSEILYPRASWNDLTLPEPSIQNAPDTTGEEGMGESLIYNFKLSNYLFENKLVTRSKKTSRITRKKTSVDKEYNNHKNLQEMFKKLF